MSIGLLNIFWIAGGAVLETVFLVLGAQSLRNREWGLLSFYVLAIIVSAIIILLGINPLTGFLESLLN